MATTKLKKTKSSFASSTKAEKTTKTGQTSSGSASSSQTSSKTSKSGSTQSSGTSGTKSFFESSSTPSRSSTGTSSKTSGFGSKTSTGNTDTSTRRTGTVTVPKTSVQQETEQERNKWREIANWLTSPLGAAVSTARGGGDSKLPQRLGNIVEAAAKDTAAGYTGTSALISEATSRSLHGDASEQTRQAYTQRAQAMGYDPNALILGGALDNLSRSDAEQAVQGGENVRRQMYGTAANLSQEAQTAQTEAKDGLGTIGSLLTDAGVAGLEMLGDVIAGAALGGNNMVPMLVRSFGGGVNEAAQKGGDVGDQIFTGTKNAAVEWVTEHIFGGNPVYDKAAGMVDKAAEKALVKTLGESGYRSLVNSMLGRIMKVPAGMIEEGLEEVIGDYLSPLADSIRNAAKGEGWSYEAPESGDVAREFAVGAILGGLGQAGGAVVGRGNAAQEAAQRTGIDADISNIVDTALGVKPAENGDVQAIVQRAVDNAVAEEAPVEAVEAPVEVPAAEPAAPMTLDEREADVQARYTDWFMRRQEMEQRGQNGGTVTAEEMEALDAEFRQLNEEAAGINAERETERAVQLGEQRAADGQTSAARGTAENHIDNRSFAEVGDTRIKAFQFDQPEMHPYYAEAAQQLMDEALASQENTHRGYVPGRNGKPGTNYTHVSDSNLVKKLKRQGIGSLNDIIKACQAIIDDNGQENYAVAKRVEMFLDDMLTNGYYGYTKYDSEGNRSFYVEPNQAYIDAKNRIIGAKTEWQKYLEDSSLILGLGEVTEEQLAQEFIAEHPDLAWQVTGEEAPTVEAQQTAEETAGAEAAANAVDAVNAEAETAATEPVVPVDVQTEQELPGTRPTIPEPTMPMEPDGRSGVNWENRFQTEQATPMPEGMRQSKSYETVKNAEPTSEAMQSIMDTEGFQSIARYAATTNQADVDNAIAYLRKNGYTASMDSFIKDANAGNSGAELVARGALLLKAASDMGRMRDFADLYVAYKTIGTRAGQTTQAFKIYQKLLNMVDGYALNMTPQDKVYLMRKSVAEYNAEIPNKKHLSARQRGIQLELDEGLVQQFLNAQTDEQRAEIQQAILDDLGQQAPASWVEKLNSWRYFSMLFNPRTHIRNMASNAVSWPVVLVKDKVAQAMEHFFISDASERTKATLDFRSGSQDRVNLAYASQFYDNFLRDDAGSKWYDENGKNEIDRNKTIFKKFGLLEKGNRANSNLLDVEDVMSSRPAFAIAFARECKVQGITAEDIETGRADAGTVQGMIDRAQRYSQEMVFRESSKLATRLAQQANSGGVWGTIVDATLPFKRTPANILTRGWQYSPMGLAQGILEYNTKVERGEMTAAQAIDDIAKGVTGTGLIAIGALLASMGFLTGGGSDDDKQDAFDTLRGRQDYSFQFGNHYISAENFGFEAIPLLLGATIYDEIQNARGADGSDESGTPVLDAIVNGALNMTQPVFETTMLSTINSLFTDLQYSNGKWVQTLLTSLGENFLNQFFPTIGGATERTFLENRRETTFTDRTGGGSFDVFGRNIDSSDGLLRGHKDAQYETGYILNRIPGVEYNQIPYLDAWGREQDTGNLLERFVNNFLNPANMSERRDAGVEDELQRLYDAGFDNVFPTRAPQSVKVNQHNLTADEYVTYQQTLGQESLAGLESLMSSDDWSTMSDEEKAASIEAVYKMAKDAAETAVDPDSAEKDETITKNKAAIQSAYGFDDAQYTAAYTRYGSDFLTNETTQTMYDAGVDLGDYYDLDQSMKALPKAGSKVQGWQKLISVSNSNLTDDQKETFYRTVITSDNVWKEWEEARDSGKSMEQWVAEHGYDSYKSGSQYYVGGSGSSSKQTASGDAQTRADFMRDIAGILAG